MSRPELASREEIDSFLEEYDSWSLDGNAISREIVAVNFVAIIAIVNAIAIIAEKFDHHPDMLIYGWNKLRINLSTHDKGGLTSLDFRLAKEIEGLNP